MAGMVDRHKQREQFESRLARALIDRGILTPGLLKEAIRQQITLGGHLATNLWEMGLVDGARLTQLSAELLGVRILRPRQFDDPDSLTLSRLPIEFVESKRILPLALSGRRLQVATCEPWDHMALGEAAFHSGYPVEPYFLPEVPIVRLLSKYYDIPLGARFRMKLPAKANEPERSAADIPWEELPELPAEIATVVSTGEPEPAEVVQPVTGPVVEKPLQPIATLAEAIRALEAAEERDEVGGVLVRFARSRSPRVALLTYRAGQWSGWLGDGAGIDPVVLRRLMLPVDTGSAFGLVADTGAHYVGPLYDDHVHHTFLEALGAVPPSSAAILPVHYRGRLVFALYMDGGAGRNVSTDVGDLIVLAHRVPQALERLVARRLADERNAG